MFKNWLRSLQRKWLSFTEFFDERTIGRLNRGPAPRFHRVVHFWLMVIRGFARNRCPMHAAALAYTSLLALIPILFVAISISNSVLKPANGQRIDRYLSKFLLDLASPVGSATNIATAALNNHSTNTIAADITPETVTDTKRLPETGHGGTNANSNYSDASDGPGIDVHSTAGREEIVRTVNGFIRNIQRGSLGVTGIVVLVFVAITLLNRIETTFNDIWNVKVRRSIVSRIVQYWAVLTLGPVLLGIALNLASGPDLKFTKELLNSIYFFHYFLYEVLPVIILCLTFSLFYFVIPNTKVSWQAATVGGLVAGILWNINNYFSFLYVSRWVTNSKIYGSLAVIPVLMVGLYLSWLILLFGAQVAHGFQNRKIYQQEKQCNSISQRGREFVALRIMEYIGEHFQHGAGAVKLIDLALSLHIPQMLVEQITDVLVDCRLLVNSTDGEIAFTPARPLEKITCHDILLALRAGQGQELFTREEPSRAEVFGEFERIIEAEKAAASAVTVLTMVQRAEKLAAGIEPVKALPEAKTV